MEYSERGSPAVKLGCLPATVFGFVVATPALFAIFMGECVNERGWIASCPHRGPYLLATLLVTGALCLLITRTTNSMVVALKRRGLGAVWGVAGGFAFGAALVVLLYELFIVAA